MIVEELVDELLKLPPETQKNIYEIIKLIANTEKVVEIYTKSFLVHPETYANETDALAALRQLSRVRGRDLRYGSEIRADADGLLQIYELDNSE